MFCAAGMECSSVAYYEKIKTIAFKNYKPFFKGALDLSGRYLKIMLDKKDDKNGCQSYSIDLSSKDFQIIPKKCVAGSPRYVYQQQHNSIYDTQRETSLHLKTKQQFEAPYMFIHDDANTALCLRGGSCLYPHVEVTLYAVQPFTYGDVIAQYPYFSVSWFCLSSDKKIAVILLNDKDYSRLDFYDLSKKRNERDYADELLASLQPNAK